jgi:hypothetical protein
MTALLLAAVLPAPAGRRRLLLEADGDGGSLAIRYQLGREPGVVSLAAACRYGLAREDLWAHAQQLPGGIPVVLASDVGDQTERSLAAVGAQLGDWLATLPDLDVIVDCGRLRPGSGAEQLALRADVVVMVARPVADQLQPAAQRMAALSRSCRVGWVLVGDTPYGADDVESAYRFPVWGVLPFDPKAASAFDAGAKKFGRSTLMRAARPLAPTLLAQVHLSQLQRQRVAGSTPATPAPRPQTPLPGTPAPPPAPHAAGLAAPQRHHPSAPSPRPAGQEHGGDYRRETA